MVGGKKKKEKIILLLGTIGSAVIRQLKEIEVPHTYFACIFSTKNGPCASKNKENSSKRKLKAK
jgi:hypothetical protein